MRDQQGVAPRCHLAERCQPFGQRGAADGDRAFQPLQPNQHALPRQFAGDRDVPGPGQRSGQPGILARRGKAALKAIQQAAEESPQRGALDRKREIRL